MSDGAHDRLAAFQFFARINAFQRVLLNTLLHKSIGDRGEHRFCLHRWLARIRMHGDQKAGKARQAIVGCLASIDIDGLVRERLVDLHPNVAHEAMALLITC